MDHNSTSAMELDGPHAWVQFELAGGEAPLAIDRLELETAAAAAAAVAAAGGGGVRPRRPRRSAGGSEWACDRCRAPTTARRGRSSVGRRARFPKHRLRRPVKTGPRASRGSARPARRSGRRSRWGQPARARFYRVTLDFAGGPPWALAEVAFFDGGRRVEVGGPYNFTSAWMPEGKGEEWVYVDLGARCTFDRVALYWIRRAAEGSIQVSDDAASWTDIAAAAGGDRASNDDIKLSEARAGKIRARTDEAAGLARGLHPERAGSVRPRRPGAAGRSRAAAVRADGRLDLAGGALAAAARLAGEGRRRGALHSRLPGHRLGRGDGAGDRALELLERRRAAATRTTATTS